MSKPKKPDAWMPFYVGDYLKDTGHLTRDQHGGYLLLLLAAWPRSGRLPNDDSQLANLAKATAAEWRRLRPVLATFFDVSPEFWTQKRLLREFESSLERKAKAEAKAKAAADKRWGNDASSNAPSIPAPDAPSNAPGNAPSNQRALLEECPSSSSSPLSIESEVRKSVPPKVNGHKKPEGAGTRLHSTWRIPEELIAWTTEAYPELDRAKVIRMSIEFRDFWSAVPGQKGRKADWDATWRNNVRRKLGDA